MQIPSAQPYQPPVRPTRTATSSDISRSKESAELAGSLADSDSVSSDPFAASAYEPIQQALNNLPDSRADVVARGKELIANPTYPGVEIIGKLASMFLDDAQASLVGEN